MNPLRRLSNVISGYIKVDKAISPSDSSNPSPNNSAHSGITKSSDKASDKKRARNLSITDPRASFLVSFNRTKESRRSSSMSESINLVYNRLAQVLDSDKSREDSSLINTLKLRIKTTLAFSWIGNCYNWFLLIASFASCILCIYQTYHKNYYETPFQQLVRGDSSMIIEIFLCVLFSFDLILWLVLAEQKLDYLTR